MTNPGRPLNVLIIEDCEFDAQILVHLVRQGGFAPNYRRVDNEADMRAALAEGAWDIAIADFNLPQFSVTAALEILQESGRDIPLIVVSGGIGEATAVAAMRAGASDYLMKDNLARLVPVLERELRDAADRAARRRAEDEKRESELRYRLLWETCPDAVIVMDNSSRIHFVNPAVEQVFGFAPDELVGRQIDLLQPDHLRGRHRAALERYIRTGEKRLNWRATETTGRHKNGAEFPIEVSFSDIELNGNRWFVGFIRDITDRKRSEERLRESEEQFRVAREIQERLFPRAAPACAAFDIAGVTHPAGAAGGDYFDYLELPGGCVGIVVADVAGHGLGPALLMSEVRAYLRFLAQTENNVGRILTETNRMLAGDVDLERYITLILACLDAKDLSLVYANAGHPPGCVMGAQGELKTLLARTGAPLGIDPKQQFAPGPRVSLARGDLVLFVSDGIEEATSDADEFFGNARMLEVVRQNAHRPAREIVDVLYEAVRNFTKKQGQTDDITLVVAKVVDS